MKKMGSLKPDISRIKTENRGLLCPFSRVWREEAFFYSALDEKDYDMAFEKAHALKGVLGNLALTPIYDPMSEMVELLRGRTDTDYNKYIETIKEKKKELEELL